MKIVAIKNINLIILYASSLPFGNTIACSYLPVDNTAKNTVKLVKTDNSPKSATENNLARTVDDKTTTIWLIMVPLARVETFLKKELLDIVFSKTISNCKFFR